MFSLRCLGISLLTIALGLGYGALAGDGPAVPPAEISRLITQDAKVLQEMLAKGKVDKKGVRKVKGTALVIAAYAQSAMSKENTKEMATLRDTALKLITAIDADDLTGAKKLADSLSAKPKADPAAKTEPVPLHTHIDLELVMRVFSSERLGGYGLENELGDLEESKGTPTAEQADKVMLMAYKMATVSELAKAYVPDKDEPKGKTRKAWLGFAQQFRANALALAETARAKQEIGPAARTLSKTCTACHDIFK